MMNEIAYIQLKVNFLSHFQCGYGQDFAKFARKLDNPRISLNIETTNRDGSLKPALLASSLKGVFRTASAFLLEKIGRDALGAAKITCDYLQNEGDWNRKGELCPNCRVYGGPFREYRPAEKERAKRLKSSVSFSFEGDDAVHFQREQENTYQFPNEQIRESTSRLAIRSPQLVPHAILRVSLDPFTEFAFALVSLSADLIGTGFFRVGRFTSRGYGIVRFSPCEFQRISLSDLLSSSSGAGTRVTRDSGFELAQQVLGQDPVQFLADSIRSLLAPPLG